MKSESVLVLVLIARANQVDKGLSQEKELGLGLVQPTY